VIYYDEVNITSQCVACDR